MTQLLDKFLTIVMSPITPLILGVINLVLATNTVMTVTGAVLVIIGALEWYDNWKVRK